MTIKPSPPRPKLTDAELLAMARTLRAYAGVQKFDNPITACLAKEIALKAAEKIHVWFGGFSNDRTVK